MLTRSPHSDAGIATSWIFGIVVVAVLVVGGGAWAYTATRGGGSTTPVATATTPPAPTEAVETEEPDADEPAPDTELEAMFAAMAAGNHEIICTGAVDGHDFTMYIKDFDLFRMDTSAPEAGEVHLLRQGELIHVWYPTMGTGMTWPAGEASPEGTPDDFSKLTPEDLQEFGDGTPMTCEKFVGDLTVFDLPNDVNFMSMTELTAPRVG